MRFLTPRMLNIAFLSKKKLEISESKLIDDAKKWVYGHPLTLPLMLWIIKLKILIHKTMEHNEFILHKYQTD